MDQQKDSRLIELDALRGLAALLVLLHHAWLTLPRAPGDGLEPVDWLLEETPFRVLALGRPAVIFFFVLSGYVLVRALVLRPTPWPFYAAQRALRLGFPVVASVLLSWLLWKLSWAGPLPDTLPDFANATWREMPEAGAVLRQALLLNTDADNDLNPVLWSLVHEWRLGLLLPLALLARDWPSALIALGALAFAFAILAGVQVNLAYLGPDIAASLLRTLYFVLPFASGAALSLAGTPRSMPRSVRLLLGFALLVTMTFSRHDVVAVVGSILLIVLAGQNGTLAGGLRQALPVWLGRISFSLYLIHLPAMMALLHLLLGSMPAAAILALSLPITLCAAVVMHATCEKPAQRISRRLALAGVSAMQSAKQQAHQDKIRPLARLQD